MPVISATKKALADAIRSQCIKCMTGAVKAISECPSHSCPLWPYRMGYKSNEPSQQHLFLCCDKGDFFFTLDNWVSMEAGESFTASDMRRSVKIKPLHPNWWGAYFKRLPTRGYHIAGTAKATTRSRNGGFQMVWKKA